MSQSASISRAIAEMRFITDYAMRVGEVLMLSAGGKPEGIAVDAARHTSLRNSFPCCG